MAYTGNSIVDYLKSVGQDSSYSARKKLAEQNGISGYKGTAQQNLSLLSKLRSGGSSSGSTNTASTNTTTQSAQTTPKTTTTPSATQTSASVATQKSTPLNGVTEDIYGAMTKEFAPSDNYNNAMSMIQSQLTQLNSGKTSYSDQIAQLMDDYMNRDKFEYNPDTDALFQNALAGAMNAGQSAMQDTMGQASMLTGGYGSSYATSAANQAYNSLIEGAYDNLPEYYNMALNAYNMESEKMLNQLNMLNTADQTEWGRMYDAYGANADFANQMYNREYQQWSDSVNNAYNMANMQNSDYWSQTNYDQAEKWNQMDFDYQKERDAVEDAWRQKEWDFSQEQWEWQKAQAAKSSSGGGGGGSSSGSSGSSGYSYANGENIKASKMTEIINGARAAQSAGGDSSVYSYLKAQGLSNSTYQYVLSVLEDTHEDTVKKSAKTTLANGFLSAALRGYTK